MAKQKDGKKPVSKYAVKLAKRKSEAPGTYTVINNGVEIRLPTPRPLYC